MRSEVVVDENAVASATGTALQRQGDQIPETSPRQGVLARKETIIRPEPEIGAPIHGFGEYHRPQTPRDARRNGLLEEYPDMPAVAGARTFQRGGNGAFTAGVEIGQSIGGPRPTVEIHRDEVAGLVKEHWVDTHHERLALIVDARQVPANLVVGYGEESAVGALGALDARLAANAGHPFVGTRRRVARPARRTAFEPSRIDILAPSEESTKQSNLAIRRRSAIDAGEIHRNDATRRSLGPCASIANPASTVRGSQANTVAWVWLFDELEMIV